MSDIKNKTVLITGAASGIGFLMGKKALERGAKHLIIWDVNEEGALKATQRLTDQGFSVSSYVVDVMKAEQVDFTARQVLEKHGKVDILINNAGIIIGKLFHQHSYKDIERTMGINSMGLMYVTRALMEPMVKSKSGHIVNIASAAGLTPNPFMTVYASSKWAAVGWSDSLRLELASISKNLRVLTVMPSYIDTGMFEGVSQPLFVPLLKPDKISEAILDAIEHNKIHLKKPFMVNLTMPFRGLLPAKVYDLVAGKFFKVYKSMSTFTGRKDDQ